MNRPFHKLELQNYLEEDSRFFVARFFFRSDMGSHWHAHDYAELFWITRGKCRHTLEDGEEILTVGDVRFMRPEQIHSLDHVGKEPLHLTNIAFPADALEQWLTSYPVLDGHFFWTGKPRPGGIKLDATKLDELEQQTHRLATRTGDLFFLHRFLFDLFLGALPPAPDTRDIPGWLKDGLAALDDQSVFSEGPAAFARACSRSPEHVSRACRKHLGKTPGELVNEARMKDAARQLRMSDHDILNIMMDCGLANPSHFYKLFKAQYGETPRNYRLAHRGLVGR
jgi:AraC family cel operon transcriptional repressor